MNNTESRCFNIFEASEFSRLNVRTKAPPMGPVFSGAAFLCSRRGTSRPPFWQGIAIVWNPSGHSRPAQRHISTVSAYHAAITICSLAAPIRPARLQPRGRPSVDNPELTPEARDPQDISSGSTRGVSTDTIVSIDTSIHRSLDHWKP